MNSKLALKIILVCFTQLVGVHSTAAPSSTHISDLSDSDAVNNIDSKDEVYYNAIYHSGNSSCVQKAESLVELARIQLAKGHLIRHENLLSKSINQKKECDRKQVSPYFKVQLFAGQVEDKALLAKYTLKDQGFRNAFITEDILTSNTTFYHVFAGEFKRETQAREIIKSIIKNSAFDRYGTPYLLKTNTP